MHQGSEGRHPSSPQGSSGSMSKFSLLGQQLTTYGSTVPQQQQHQQHQQHQNLPNSANPTNMNFSLGIHPQQQPHGPSFASHSSHGGHSQSQSQQSCGVVVGGSDGGAGFPSMQNVNSLVGAIQGFTSQNHQFVNQQQQHQVNPRQQQPPQVAQTALVPESIMNFFEVLQQKLVQLESYVVPLVAGQNSQVANPIAHQQAAAATAGYISVLTQLTQAARSNIEQQQNSMPVAGQAIPEVDITQQQQQQQQMGQLFGAPVSQAFNFFQPNGLSLNSNNNSMNPSNNNSPAGGNVLGSSNNNNSFSAMQGGSIPGMGAPPISLAGQLSNSSNNAVGPKGTSSPPPTGGQGFGMNNGSALSSNNSTLGLGVRNSKHVASAPHNNNQMGSAGVSRGGAGVPSMGNGEITHMNRSSLSAGGLNNASSLDDHDGGGNASRDEDDDGDEALPPGSYELIEMDSMEILAEHTHFCEICGKGFKRDANLRMHMRGHGDEYKTPAALARPDKASHDLSIVRPRRFSCPYVGCKRNKKHRKFQPLKTMLCVKNHYRRSHCPKMLTCAKCKTKKFSVVADLKTHEKHCGCDKWQCSCGTTFSRKDKLFGHIGLFAGHTAMPPFNEMDNNSPGGGGLELSDIAISSSNPSTLQMSSNNSNAGFGLSSNGLSSGGSGMGLGGNNSNFLQGLGSRGGGGGNGLNISKEGGKDNVADPFPQTGNHMLPSSMLQGLFTTNFLQGTSGGNSPSDGLH